MSAILAVGQLAASSAALLMPSVERPAVSVTLHNTGSTDQEVTLLVTRSGSATSQVIDHATLAAKETRRVRGIALDPSDTLAGYATSGSMVDYVAAAGDGITAATTQADGAPQASDAVAVTVSEQASLTQGDIEIVKRLDRQIELLLKIS